MHGGCGVYIRDLGVLGVEMAWVLGAGRGGGGAGGGGDSGGAGDGGGGAGDEVAVDERPAALETALLDEDEDDASDLGRLCAYIGTDPLAPVRGWNRC